MDEQHYELLVGIDWGTVTHVAEVLRSDGKAVASRKVKQTGEGIREFLDWLTLLAEGRPETVAVGIETPHGSIVEGLIERQFHVYAINPKQVDRFRDRHFPSGAKDDTKDAFVLADSLRNDRRCYYRVQLHGPKTTTLREHSRIWDELREESSRLSNRLREHLGRYYQQALALCPTANEPWFWALLELAPTPEKAAGLSKKQMETLLKSHRIRRYTAQAVADALRQPSLPTGPGVTEAASIHVAMLLPRLTLVHQQLGATGKAIDAVLADIAASGDGAGQTCEHRDIDILRSLPGLGRRTVAAMLAEAGFLLRARDYHGIRTLAGAAPVTRKTGKQKRGQVLMRRACNGRLRDALYNWAFVSINYDDLCRKHYDDLRNSGHRHARALRSVLDRLLRILMGCLRSGERYDRAKLGKASNPVQARAGAAT